MYPPFEGIDLNERVAGFVVASTNAQGIRSLEACIESGASLATILGQDNKFERALAALRTGSAKDAERMFRSILRKEPRHVGALNLIGVTLTQLGNFTEAEKHLRRALEISAPSEVTLFNYGTVLKALKRPTEALDRLSQALALNSSVAETWNNRGTIHNDLNRYEEAIDDFDRALRLNPRYTEALYNKGKSLASLKRFQEALPAFDTALALKPDFAEAWCGRGDASWGLERYDDALAACEKALALRPSLAEAWLGRGNVFAKRKEYDAALQAYQRAAHFKPDLAEAWLVSGNICMQIKRHDDAIHAYQKALAAKSDFIEAAFALGSTLLTLNRNTEAFAAFETVLSLKPDLPEAWVGRGNVFYKLKQYDAALTDFDRALTLKHNSAEAWHNRAIVLQDLKQYAAAILAYDAALEINPNLNYAAGFRLFAKQLLCDWTNLEAETEEFLARIRTQDLIAHPFALLALPSLASDQLQCAKRFMETFPVFPSHSRGKNYSHNRTRVAYLSADFDNHAVSHLLVGLLEHHDTSRFEITGISFGPYQNSQVGQRIQGACERFIDVRAKSDQEVAHLIRELEIDIAIDLMGHTQDSRPHIFAQRPAPIQVSYLGYLGTTGADFIDYVIADKAALPFDQQDCYSEKIVYLPDCFLVNDNRLEIAGHTPSRQDVGLPAEGFVFCSFNNSYKLGRTMFEVWMRMLHAVQGSVLWLVESNAEMVTNLRREARSCGIDSNRLIFAPRVVLPEHLARQRLAGLFLDTIPYNAGATAAAALWAGLPVLTLIGETFVGRMAASMLQAVGLPELVTDSLTEYEALALQIATDSVLCAALKDKLARNRGCYPLFDTGGLVRHMEAAYETMRQVNQNGRRPIGFTVDERTSN